MSLFGPSNSDIQAFKQRINGNPVVDAVVSYIQSSTQAYSIAVFKDHIALKPFYAFHDKQDPTSFNNAEFIFSKYSMQDIPHIKYQEAVADVIKQRITNRFQYKNIKVFPYYEFKQYDEGYYSGRKRYDYSTYGFRSERKNQGSLPKEPCCLRNRLCISKT